MSRFVALGLALLVGCASAENALPGDDRDLSTASDDGGGDFAIGRPSDMLPGDRA